MTVFQGKTVVTHWLMSKDNGAKAANLPRAAMSADIQAMEGNMMVGGDLGPARGYRPVVMRSGKVDSTKRSCFDPKAARSNFVHRVRNSKKDQPFVCSVHKIIRSSKENKEYF